VIKADKNKTLDKKCRRLLYEAFKKRVR